MGKELQIKLPDDFEKINTNNLGELIWWTNHLNISPENLLAIIDKRGNSVKEIRKYLNEHSC